MGIKQFIGYALVVLASLVVSAQGSDFAFYKLSLIWPTSACYPLSNCKTPLPTFFTIHGLWPTFANDTAVPPYGPNNRCNANPVGPDAAVARLTPIKDRLDQRWPNLRAGVENSVFWRHEWQNHGICSDYPQDPLSYFNDTLNLATSTKFDPFKALGVQPSNTPYLLNTLLQNVYKNVGAYPQISCSQRSGGALYLREIRFCLTRTKKTPPSVVQSCPTRVAGGCNDPLTNNVHFPLPISALQFSINKITPWPWVVTFAISCIFIVVCIMKDYGFVPPTNLRGTSSWYPKNEINNVYCKLIYNKFSL